MGEGTWFGVVRDDVDGHPQLLVASHGDGRDGMPGEVDSMVKTLFDWPSLVRLFNCLRVIHTLPLRVKLDVLLLCKRAVVVRSVEMCNENTRRIGGDIL